MGVKQYQLGKKHALSGVRALAHRKGRRYDSQSANESYVRGYSAGTKERYSVSGKVGLDYSNLLNNQQFEG